MLALRHPLAALAARRQLVAFDQGHALEVVAERPRRCEARHAAAQHDGVLSPGCHDPCLPDGLPCTRRRRWGDSKITARPGTIIRWPDGSPIWPQKPTAWFRQHCRTLGLPEIGIHGLRHTAATWMIARGESPKLVQQRLGHSHVSVTLGLYSHVQPGHDQAVADAFGAALDGGS